MGKILSLFLGIMFLFGLSPMIAQAADKLIMFDARSCGACKQFKREMAPSYRRSSLGKKVPLRIVNANGRGMKRYSKRVGPIVYTPTFVLMRNGREIARLVGYGGRKKFMSLVRKMRRR